MWAHFMAKGRRPRPDELERDATMRYFAGRGGPFRGGGPMFGPPFGGGRGRRRRGDVRLALLLLLAEEPRNGYQLMQEIEERSDGRWRPSPGSVYPTLQQLEDEALIRPTERDGVKLFELTDAGRAHLDTHTSETPPWEEEEDAATLTDLKAQLKQLHVAAMQVASGRRRGPADARGRGAGGRPQGALPHPRRGHRGLTA